MRSIFFAAATALAVFSQATSALPVDLSTSAPSPATFAVVPFARSTVEKPQKEKLPSWELPNDPSAMFTKQQLAQNPKRRNKALAPRVSPSVGLSGTIQVVESNGTVLGYVSTGGLTGEYFQYDPDVTSAATVTVPTSGTNVNVALSGASNPYLGIFNYAFDGSADLNPVSENYGGFTASQAVTSGSIPSSATNNFDTQSGNNDLVETAIWTYSSVTGLLTPTWVNPSGTLSAVSIMTSTPSDDTILYATGDPNSFVESTGSQYFAVTFKFVSS